MKCCWILWYDLDVILQNMNIQTFIMDDLIVCMSFKFEYSIVANKEKFLSLKEICFMQVSFPASMKEGKSSTKEKSLRIRN